MTGKAAQLAGRAVDFVLPPRCHACGELVDASGRLCARCWSDLNFITPPHCALCGFPFEYDQGEGATCGSCLRRAPPFEAARSAL
ncbi:MAG: double zinc ribbon domain-containing protein, partial [Sphingomonadales bacterium]|nr:double zinc ribbon domain-containing protein [Sphingomonadales bacterium]